MSYDALDDFAGAAFSCKDCGETRTRPEMFWTTLAGGGQCRPCRRVYRQGYYQRTKEESKRRATAWKRANPERMKDFHRKAKYGVEYGTYARLLAEQAGRCAICGAPEPDDRSLHIDHDHQSGSVRSLLCDLCNRGLGYFAEDPARIDAAAAYLRRWGK